MYLYLCEPEEEKQKEVVRREKAETLGCPSALYCNKDLILSVFKLWCLYF